MDYLRYPRLIIATRYGGIHEGGPWAAFPCDPGTFPAAATANEVECAEWWRQPTMAVGVGWSPDEALQALEVVVDGCQHPVDLQEPVPAGFWCRFCDQLWNIHERPPGAWSDDLDTLRPRAIARALEDASSSDSNLRRAAAVTLASEANAPETWESLAGLLTDDDPRVIETTADCLLAREDEMGMGLFLNAFGQADYRVASYLRGALARVAERPTILQLLQRAASVANPAAIKAVIGLYDNR